MGLWDVKLTCHVNGAGAKGKFSGGFDITAFGGIQRGNGTFNVLYVLYSSSA